MMNSKISATSCWWFILKLELPDEWIQFSNATEKADGLTGDLDLPNLEMISKNAFVSTEEAGIPLHNSGMKFKHCKIVLT